LFFHTDTVILRREHKAAMKITDDYTAKHRLWAASPRVVAAPPAPRIPDFKCRRFSSHAEMNEWKRSVLRLLAQAAPAK
jgi:hypothetical protein